MPVKILGVDITEESVAAVQVTSGLKGYEITGCARIPLEEGAGGLEKALYQICLDQDLKSDLHMLAVPSSRVFFRNLQMPFKDRKKIRQTLPFQVEPEMPLRVDEVVHDFIFSRGEEQSDVLAALIPKEVLSIYLDIFLDMGIDPPVAEIHGVALASWLMKHSDISSGGLVLDIGEKSSLMALYSGGRLHLIRNLFPRISLMSEAGKEDGSGITGKSRASAVAKEVQNTLHAIEWESSAFKRPERLYITGPGSSEAGLDACFQSLLDLPVERVDCSSDKKVNMSARRAETWDPSSMSGALSLALRETKEEQGFNLRQDEFEIKKQYSGLKSHLVRAGVFLAVVISLLAADFAIDLYFLEKRYQGLGRRMESIYRETFPNARRIVDPFQQMKVGINELKKGNFNRPSLNGDNRVLDLLADISTRIPASVKIKITTMVIDQEGIRMSGRTDNFNTVDTIKGALEPSEYFDSITISSANLDRSGESVQFELKLQRKAKG